MFISDLIPLHHEILIDCTQSVSLLYSLIHAVVRATDRLAPGLNLERAVAVNANDELVSLQRHYLISYDEITVNPNDIFVHRVGLNLSTGRYILYLPAKSLSES